MAKFFRKDWVLYQEVANEGGKPSADLIKMDLKKDDPDKNKHIPFIIETDKGYEVKTGKSEFHGMDSEHHIMFIDLYVDDKYHYRQYFKYGNNPEKPLATFDVPKGKKVIAIGFCNLHGLWTYELTQK